MSIEKLIKLFENAHSIFNSKVTIRTTPISSKFYDSVLKIVRIFLVKIDILVNRT